MLIHLVSNLHVSREYDISIVCVFLRFIVILQIKEAPTMISLHTYMI